LLGEWIKGKENLVLFSENAEGEADGVVCVKRKCQAVFYNKNDIALG
jgi:hypothetical protein